MQNHFKVCQMQLTRCRRQFLFSFHRGHCTALLGFCASTGLPACLLCHASPPCLFRTRASSPLSLSLREREGKRSGHLSHFKSLSAAAAAATKNGAGHFLAWRRVELACLGKSTGEPYPCVRQSGRGVPLLTSISGLCKGHHVSYCCSQRFHTTIVRASGKTVNVDKMYSATGQVTRLCSRRGVGGEEEEDA